MPPMREWGGEGWREVLHGLNSLRVHGLGFLQIGGGETERGLVSNDITVGE